MGKAKNVVLGLFLLALPIFYPSYALASTNYSINSSSALYSNTPDTNYYITSGSIFLSWDEGPTENHQTLLDFDITSPPESTSTIELSTTISVCNFTSSVIDIYSVLSEANPNTVTWNTKPNTLSLLGSINLAECNGLGEVSTTLDSSKWSEITDTNQLLLKINTNENGKYARLEIPTIQLTVDDTPTAVGIVTDSSSTFSTASLGLLAIIIPIGIVVLITFTLFKKAFRNFRGISKV